MGIQSKQIKSRKCKHCKKTYETTASGLKKHATVCGGLQNVTRT